MTFAVVVVCLAIAASLPYWLPEAVVALRIRLFTRINGEEGIPIPGRLIDAAHFKQVYAHPAASGRSRGAALSDLFWYWLSPGPEIHQEHVEPGERYERIAQTTRRLLALPKKTTEDIAVRSVALVLDALGPAGARSVRARDLMMPIWGSFYYELVFGERCPEAACSLIVENANDVVTALKCCGLRHMSRRNRLTRFLVEKLRNGEAAQVLSEGFSLEERALYLQGVFFNTAVVQMSEAMTHLLLLLAEHPAVQESLVEDPDDQDAFDRVIHEALRIHPLFAISHRITSDEIPIDDHTTIPKDSVLCFNHATFHRTAFENPEKFDPDRWKGVSLREANFVPFGIAQNRPCPAQALAMITLRIALRETLARFRIHSSVRHTRSIPNRGPCLLVPRSSMKNPAMLGVRLTWMHLRDRWEDVGRSIAQLAFGTFMVWHARRLRPCERYFEARSQT